MVEDFHWGILVPSKNKSCNYTPPMDYKNKEVSERWVKDVENKEREN